MKRELFSCDYCDIEKFNSETQQYENVPFVCETLAHWKQHTKRIKHCLNVERNNNLEDDLIVECKHCNGIFTQDQYKQHKQHNQLLWASKSFSYTKDCSCNNFCYGKKRFEKLQELREYVNIKEKYSYGKNKNINYTKKEYDRALEILQDRQEHENKLNEIRQENEAKLRKELDEKRAKEALTLQDKKKKPILSTAVVAKQKKEKVIAMPPIDNITMSIEDEFNELNGLEEKEDPKIDLNTPPIWDSEDICDECGKPDNSFREYSEHKLKNYKVSLCDCEDSDSDYE